MIRFTLKRLHMECMANGHHVSTVTLTCGALKIWRYVVFVTFAPRQFRCFEVYKVKS